MDRLDLIIGKPGFVLGIILLGLGAGFRLFGLVVDILEHELLNLPVDLQDTSEGGGVGSGDILQVLGIDVGNLFDGSGQQHGLVFFPPLIRPLDHGRGWLCTVRVPIDGFREMDKVRSILGNYPSELGLVELVERNSILDFMRFVRVDKFSNGIGRVGDQRIDLFDQSLRELA